MAEPDGQEIAVSFPVLTADEQAIFARELGQDLIRDGVDASAVKIARSDAEAMDLGGLVIVAAGALGWEFLTSAAKGAGEAVGREAGRDAYGYVRRKVEDLCRRRRIRADVTARGHTWVLGGEHDRSDPAPDLAMLGGRAGTLGVVILGASRFPYCDGLDNPAFARSAVAARDLFAAPGPVFGRTAVLDLFDSQAHPGEIVEAIERHIDAHPDMTDVLIYYCGHGSFTRDRTYFLTLAGTRLGREASTGLKLKDLRHDLETRLADRRLYVVLDCCFAGEAAKEFMGAGVDRAVEAAIHEALPPGGWLVLAASPASSVAMAPAGQYLTMFTGALVDVIGRAIRPLSLDEITAETRRAILSIHGGRGVFPECHAPRQSGGDLRRVPMFGGRAEAAPVAPPRPAPAPTPAERRPVAAPAVASKPPDPEDAQGLYELGNRYLGGVGVANDEREATRLFRLAAGMGHAEAQYHLGGCYANGQGVTKDQLQAARLLRLAAGQGHADAQYQLGVYYQNGTGIEKNEQAAVRLYRLAADQGHAHAQYILGICYNNGTGVEKDEHEAVRLYQLAADQGDPKAQIVLGVCSYYGRGVTKDEWEATRLFRLAAEQGHAAAQCWLGYCYARGAGVTLNEVEAARLYRLATEQGHAAAQCLLGQCYAEGRGVAKNHSEASRLLHLAADQGNSDASRILGNYYEFGIHFEKDFEKALKFFRKAYELGDDQSLQRCNHVLDLIKLRDRPADHGSIIKSVIDFFGRQ